jgi:hypothetical protein
METEPLILGIMTIALVCVTIHAWRLGNERRDVVLLGTFAGLFGVGTAAVTLV